MKSRRKLIVGSVLVGFLPFVVLELGLRLMGVGDDVVDQQAAYAGQSRLFELSDDSNSYQIRRPRLRFFAEQQFPAKKPDNEFRIFCLGGSTVQGRPYGPETAFGEWLALELDALDPNRSYRTVNCGGISYASYRLTPICREVLEYEPDLIVLLTGHNEFLEDQTYGRATSSNSRFSQVVDGVSSNFRTVQLVRSLLGKEPQEEPQQETPASDVEARLDNPAGYASYERDEQWYQQVEATFRTSVETMAAACQDAQVPLILVKPDCNLRNCPPLKSQHRSDLTAEDQQRWQALFDRASASTDPEQAFQLYKQAADIDDTYAVLLFRMARCADQLQDAEAAADLYRRAREADVCPLRIRQPLADILGELAETKQLPLVDMTHRPTDVPGFDRYIDHVHPTIHVHQQMAAMIVERLVGQSVVKTEKKLTVDQRRKLYAAHFDQLPFDYFSNGRRRIGWLENWAQQQRIEDENTDITLIDSVRRVARDLDLHRFDKVEEGLAGLPTLDSSSFRHCMNVAFDLYKCGRTTDCRRWLKMLDESTDPKQAEVVQTALDSLERQPTVNDFEAACEIPSQP